MFSDVRKMEKEQYWSVIRLFFLEKSASKIQKQLVTHEDQRSVGNNHKLF